MRCKMCGQTKHFALVIVGTEKICLECLARAVSVYEKLSAKQFFDVVKAHNIDMEENVDDDF